MSQAQDWNTSAPVQAVPPIPAQAPPQPQYGQPFDRQPFDGQQQNGQQPQYAPPVMAPGAFPPPGMMQAPAGMYYDDVSGLNLPQGTKLATVGRRIGAYFLGILLAAVTLGIGYIIWGAITWSKGQSPVQQLLGLQTWKPQEQANATWGTMFLRGLASMVVNFIPFGQIVSFFIFLSGKEHRALHDSMSSTIVLHDPDKVLRPAAS